MKLKSQILTSSNSFKENVKKHLKDIENIKKVAKLNSLGGPESSRERHIKRGKMLPRDRVSGLLDVGSYFLEIGSFAAQDLYDGAAPGAGLIAGMTSQTIAVIALLSAGAVSRALIALAMNQLELVRTDGLASQAGQPTNESTLVTLALGGAIAFLLLGAAGWFVLAFAFGATVLMGLYAKRQIGGQTGDVLGTVQQVTETAVLLGVILVM